jgi:fluoroquinolone resistance protein
MNVELDPKDKALLQDIQAFNREYAVSGWHLQDKLVQEDFSRLVLCRSSMVSVVFQYTNWRSALLTDSEFTNVEFDQCSFKEARLSGVVFRHCLFRFGSFAGATLTNCSFHNCKADQWNARAAKLKDCAFDSCEDTSGVFANATLENCRWNECRWYNSSFYGVTFQAVAVKGSSIDSVIFSDIHGSHLSFEDDIVQRCSFEDSRYGSLTLERGSVRGVTFRAFHPQAIAIRNCASMEVLTVRDSIWRGPSITGCPAVCELMIDRSQMSDLAIERNQMWYFTLSQTEVSGDSRISDCMLAGWKLENSTLRRTRIVNCTIGSYLKADGATLDGVALTDISYAPGLRRSLGGVTYLNGSTELPN